MSVYRGVVRNGRIELEGEHDLTEGVRILISVMEPLHMATYIGIVQNGQIRLEGDQVLPEGAQVRIIVVDNDDDVEELEEDQGITGAELLQAPFIGVWADRDDIGDTVEFVEKLRRKWERRVND
jgi:hypothetical protein